MVEQTRALDRVTDLVDAHLWSARQRQEWTQMLHAMVHAMDWRTGLIVGVTRDRLGALVGRSATTVSRMWAWAEDVGLLARVEEGAPAKWLGTRHNRAAAFTFVAPKTSIVAAPATEAGSAQLNEPVDKLGNHPTTYVGKKPLDGQTSSQTNQPRHWPAWRIPESPTQRRLAAAALLTRIGLDPATLGSRRRVHGLLLPWWQQGWCIAGLLYAIDHDPDTHQTLGDALRGARDPLGTIGARLIRWSNRHYDLPPRLHGHRGDYQAAQARRLAAAVAAAENSHTSHRGDSEASGQIVRAAAKAALAEHLRELSNCRRTTTDVRQQVWLRPSTAQAAVSAPR